MPNAPLGYLYFLICFLLSMIYWGLKKLGETSNQAGLQRKINTGLLSNSRAPTKLRPEHMKLKTIGRHLSICHLHCIFLLHRFINDRAFLRQTYNLESMESPYYINAMPLKIRGTHSCTYYETRCDINKILSGNKAALRGEY